MDIKTATEITRIMCQTKRKIEAIILLRRETNFGLTAAKEYLERYSYGGTNEVRLFQQLCDDFVQNKKDLLVLLVREQRLLKERIENLMREISEEENEIAYGNTTTTQKVET